MVKKMINLSEIANMLEDRYGKKRPIITHISNVLWHSCIIVYIAEVDGVGYVVFPSMFGYDYDDCIFYDDETNQVVIK